MLDIGTNVRVRGVYADAGRTIPVTGTVEDIFDFDGVTSIVVIFDEATIRAGMENGMAGVPPGGEFSSHRLELA